MKNIILQKTEEVGNQMASLYDQMLMNALKHANDLDEMMFGKIIRYRNVKVPKYLTVKIPVISRDYDNDSEYGDGSFRGLLISTREVKLFRIGTAIERQPVRKKSTGKTIKWERYSPLGKIPKTATEIKLKKK